MIEPEVHNRRFLGTSVKWVAEIDSADRVEGLISRAYYTDTSGRPGPVALALPESTLLDIPTAKQTLVHVYPGRVSATDLVYSGGENSITLPGQNS